MKLSELSKAVQAKPNHSILLYGRPKTGKTRLVGTAAKIPELKRIVFVDLENGAETLTHMGLSEQELDKIDLIKLPDTRDNPIGIVTLLKMFSSKDDVLICHNHGKIGCVECKDPKMNTVFNLRKLTHNDLLIIDSGSQLGDSALNLACAGMDITFKPGFTEFGTASKYLGDLLSTMQQAYFTNFVMVSHEIAIEEEHNGVKKDVIFPLVGSRNFCQKVGKYFGTIAHVEIKMSKHIAGSSSTFRSDCITGSRLNAKMESAKEPDMRSILIDGGVLA
jgi:hypothetical protein